MKKSSVGWETVPFGRLFREGRKVPQLSP